MADMQLLLFASELRTCAKEILVRAASTDDPEAQGTMRVVAAGYEKLARRAAQLVREADTLWPATQPEAADLLNVSAGSRVFARLVTPRWDGTNAAIS
jgi:hypothetical protein